MNDLRCRCCQRGTLNAFDIYSTPKGKFRISICDYCASFQNDTALDVLQESNIETIQNVAERYDLSRKEEQQIDDLVRDSEALLSSLCGISNIKPSECSILDFGAGSGALSIAALRLRFREVTCTDLDLDTLTNSLKSANCESSINVVNNVSELADSRFDFLILWHVLEHLVEPAEFFRTIRPKMKDGAKLVLQTPALRSNYVENSHFSFFGIYQYQILCKVWGLSLNRIMIDEDNEFHTLFASF